MEAPASVMEAPESLTETVVSKADQTASVPHMVWPTCKAIRAEAPVPEPALPLTAAFVQAGFPEPYSNDFRDALFVGLPLVESLPLDHVDRD